MTDQDQSEAIEALQSGAATGEPGPLARIDTHLSHVFLGARRAYKLKRAVVMPFVDFSTREKRRAACLNELDVNRRLAPRLYLGVEPLARGPDGALRLGGPGEPVDWLVVMRRFAPGALLDEMARDGRLDADLVARTAEAVARFHAGLEPVPDAGGPDYYRGLIAGLRRTEADGAAAHGLKPGPDDLYAGLEQQIARRAPLIERRRAAGWVRRGHGDLHLRNICLFEGEPTPFDALEFDPALATADVLYDLAFLLMDLRRRGLPALANLAMNRYWDAAGQEEAALALLPLFMALRAAVRCAVAMEAGQPEEAETYRALGLELLTPGRARLVAVGGLSGSGKSAVARQVAADLPGPCGARVLRTDVIRKAVLGAAQDEPLGEAAYAPQARAAVYRLMAARAGEALGAGAAVIADATFQAAVARQQIKVAAGGAPFQGLWLKASTAVRVARVSARSGDPSDADARVAAAQVEPELEPDWIVIDADPELETVAKSARRALDLA